MFIITFTCGVLTLFRFFFSLNHWLFAKTLLWNWDTLNSCLAILFYLIYKGNIAYEICGISLFVHFLCLNPFSSVAKHLESANTMFSFIWWIIGFYWVSAGGQALARGAPQLYWFVPTSSPLLL